VDDSEQWIVAYDAHENIPTGEPVEVMEFCNDGLYVPTDPPVFKLIIALWEGAEPGLMKSVLFGSASIDEHATNSGTLYGHANAAGAEAVGAAYYLDTPEFGTSPPELEPYSSAGGTPILFGPDGTRLTAAEIRLKPEIVAPDGVNTTFFYPASDRDGDGTPDFSGTSAAVPHAAGVAALMLDVDASPTATPAAVRSALESTALDMAVTDFDYDSGYGLVQADAAIAALNTPGVCVINADCDDGLYCNGAEVCNAGVCEAGTDPCAAAESCDEDTNVCISPPPPTTVHTESIVTGTQTAATGKGQKNGTATVTVLDSNGLPQVGLTVTGNFSGTFNENGSATTDVSGEARLVTTDTAKKNIQVDFCVSDISGGLPYNSSDDADPGFSCGAPPPPPSDLTEVYVENISTGQQGVGGGEKVGTATVTILGDNGVAQAGYEVSGQFSGDFNEGAVGGPTGADGTVELQTSGTRTGKVNVFFCVSDVEGAVTYDPGSNSNSSYACP
jgi:hypothetical protein